MKLRQRLFEPGAGWLRWGTTVIEFFTGWEEPPELMLIAPPLRRFTWWVGWWFLAARLVTFGDKYDGNRYRYSWEEARPSWLDIQMLYKDPNR